MAKNTWVNIQGTWRKSKNIWIKVGGVWKQKTIPKVNVNGMWKELIQYIKDLYKNGVENVVFSMGYSSTGGTVMLYKDDTRYRIFIYPLTGTLYINSETLVDVTSYTKLKMNCINLSGYDVKGLVGLATQKKSNSLVVVAEKLAPKTIANQPFPTEVSVDISSVSGSYYIVVGHVKVNGGSQTNLAITDIWLE